MYVYKIHIYGGAYRAVSPHIAKVSRPVLLAHSTSNSMVQPLVMPETSNAIVPKIMPLWLMAKGKESTPPPTMMG